MFDELWKKWDKTPDHGCEHSHEVGQDDVLQMNTLKGIFFLLALGLLMSIAFLLLETLWAALNDQYDNEHRTLLSKVVRRVKLKCEEVRTEWILERRPRCYSKVRTNGDALHKSSSAGEGKGLEMSTCDCCKVAEVPGKAASLPRLVANRDSFPSLRNHAL